MVIYFISMYRVAVLLASLTLAGHGRRVQSSTQAERLERLEIVPDPSSLVELLTSRARVGTQSKFYPSAAIPRISRSQYMSAPRPAVIGAAGTENRVSMPSMITRTAEAPPAVIGEASGKNPVRSTLANTSAATLAEQTSGPDEGKFTRAQIVTAAWQLSQAPAVAEAEGSMSLETADEKNLSKGASKTDSPWYIFAGAIAIVAGLGKLLLDRRQEPKDSDTPRGSVPRGSEQGVEDVGLPSGVIIAGLSMFFIVVGTIVFTVLTTIAGMDGVTLQQYMQTFDVKHTFDLTVKVIEDAGALGYLYFSVVYVLAEIVGLPAIPLTASSGYLFGALKGTGVVLLSATIAASISFGLAKTFLRSAVQGMASQNSKWRAIDKAVGREGFKVVLLLRLSPLLPFALSNYLYGLTAVDFSAYFWGTFFGFAPGTFAYVYFGQGVRDVSASVEAGTATGTPWYVYAGAVVGLAAFIKVVSNIAENAIAEMEEEEDNPTVPPPSLDSLG